MRALQIFFTLVLVGMLAVIGWASSRCALFDIPREVAMHPWFLATLADAYLAFTAFWVWLAWKERSLGARVLWLLVILLWGNPAIALYMLREVALVRREGGGLDALFTTKRPGKLLWPVILFVLGVAVYVVGAKNVLFA
jgi:hypothetical protein